MPIKRNGIEGAKTGKQVVKQADKTQCKQNKEGKPCPAQNVKRTGRNKSYENLPWLKPTLRLRIEGFNHMRILNQLATEGITLSRIQRLSPKTLELCICKKDNKKTFAILEKMCYNYSVIAESGAQTVLPSFARHIGLTAGALVFCVLFALSMQMVWKIEISGNQAVDSARIMRALDECGVRVGTFKRKVDTAAVTARLRDSAGVAEGTVKVVGTTIVVSVIEEKEYIPPLPPDTQSAVDITSGYDAEITRMTVKSGTAMYGVGAKVTAGAVLIRGERINSNGEPIEPVRAEGRIYGRVTFHEKHIFSPTRQILVRSGKKKVVSNMSLFGLTVGKKTTPQGWEAVTTTGKMFFVPIKITRTTCYQTEVRQEDIDIDEYVESLKQQAVLNSAIKAGASEINTSSTLKNMDGGLMMLNIYVQAEVVIAEG